MALCNWIKGVSFDRPFYVTVSIKLLIFYRGFTLQMPIEFWLCASFHNWFKHYLFTNCNIVYIIYDDRQAKTTLKCKI